MTHNPPGGFPARLPHRWLTPTQENVIPNESSAAYAEGFRPGDDAISDAAQRGLEVGSPGPSAATGALLSVLASAISARAVVEVGTGTGVSGLWLLQGMAPDGVLTSVDAEAEHSRLAKDAFARAGFAPARARLITGRALDVLPRLTDSGYDMVVFSGDPRDAAAGLDEAVRLLRIGGLLVVAHALLDDRVADPAQRDPVTVAMRSLVTQVGADERYSSSLVPVGDGLLVAAKRS